MKFKKYDEIQHPKFGRGIVKKVNKIDDDLSILDVQFDEAGEKKQLNSAWVEEHCICYAALPEKDVRANYTDIQLKDFPDWNVALAKEVELTPELEEMICYIMKSVIPGIGFVLIGTSSAVAFLDNEFKNYKTIEKLARRYMNSVFAGHPDFEAIKQDNNGAVIFMNQQRLWHFLKPDEVVLEDGEVSFQTGFSARSALMEQCKKKKILGILSRKPEPVQQTDGA